jgi:hypothetical protein
MIEVFRLSARRRRRQPARPKRHYQPDRPDDKPTDPPRALASPGEW